MQATSKETHKVPVEGVSEDVPEDHPLVRFEQNLYDLLHIDAGFELSFNHFDLNVKDFAFAVSVCVSLLYITVETPGTTYKSLP